MALLDVTDVLTDPDFLDIGLICARITQTVGTDGIAVNAVTNRAFAAVVTNDAGDMLFRVPEGERVKGNIMIHTSFKLSDGRAGQPTDEVIWQGVRYTVTSVRDWSHFGRGFVSASCDILPLAGG